jgi:hypothetical protein
MHSLINSALVSKTVIQVFFWGVLLFGQISKAEANNPYVKTVSPVIQKVLDFPQAEFALPEPLLFELHGDYSQFPAGALAKELLNTLQANQDSYFELDFPQWLEANQVLFKLDDYVSKNAEYGNALIKTYLNSLWLTSGYRWLTGDVVNKQKNQQFDIDRFIKQWQQIRFHTTDIESISYIYFKDILRIDFHYTPQPLEVQLKLRSLNAALDSYESHDKGLTSKLANESNNISEQMIRDNRAIFSSEQVDQKLLIDKYFRDEYILELKNKKFKERFRVNKTRHLETINSFEQLTLHLDIPQHMVVLGTAEHKTDTGRPYEIYLNLLIKAQIIKELGLSFQDWSNLNYQVYLKYCRQDPWCPPEDIERMEKKKAVLKYKTLLGTETVEYFGLIGVLAKLEKQYARLKKTSSKASVK